MHTIITAVFLVILTLSGTYAANNWNEPCHSGVCQYDLDSTGSSGTLKIWGPDTAISDITPAAGWHILACDENATEQEIRLVCTSPSAPCSHLFSDAGPKDKIVRLPEWCGANPFARVAEALVSTDQSLPTELEGEFWKRDGQLPQVFTLRLDTDFHHIDFKGSEPVSFAIQATTIPDIEHDLDTHIPIKWSNRPVQRSHTDIVSRSLESLKTSIDNHVRTAKAAFTHHIKNVVSDTNLKKADNVKAAVIHDLRSDKNNIKHDFKSAPAKIHKEVTTVKDNAQKVLEKPLHVTKEIKFGPTTIANNMTLFKQTINCPPLFPGLEIDLNPDIHIQGTIGLVVVGTIVPPRIANFSSITNFSADVNAVFTITADVAGVIDTGRILMFEVGLPGMDIPGIMSLGPKFQFHLQCRFTVDLSIGARIGIEYQVKNAQIYYPHVPGHYSTFEAVGLKNSPLHLTATPNVQAYVQFEGKAIPSISLGLSLFKDGYDIAIRADTTLYLIMQLEEDGKTKNIKKRGIGIEGERERDVRVPLLSRRNGVTLGNRTVDKSTDERTPSKTATVVKRARPSPVLRKRAPGLAPGPQPTAGGRGAPSGMNSTLGHAFRGCFEIKVTLDINAGTDSELVGIFDRNTKYSFFKKSWTLWQKCFGPPPWKKLSAIARLLRRDLHALEKRGSALGDLKCLGTSYSGAEAMISTDSNMQFSTTRKLK